MDEALKRLETWCSTFDRATYKPGETIVRLQPKPSHVHFLVSGYARLYTTTPDSREISFIIYKSGTVFPLSFIVSNWVASDSYVIEAITPVKTFVVPTSTFLSYCQKNSEISWLLLHRFSNALSGFLFRLEQTLLDKPQELIGIISYLATQFGEQDKQSNDITIPFPLTSEQLATWTGTARETVARTIALLKKRGLLRSEKRKLIVLDLPALKRLKAEQL